MYIAKIENGYVKLYNKNGGYHCYVSIPAGVIPVSAVVQGDTVAVTCADGRVRLYSAETGGYRATL